MNGDNSDETVIIGGDAFLKELAEIVNLSICEFFEKHRYNFYFFC